MTFGIVSRPIEGRRLHPCLYVHIIIHIKIILEKGKEHQFTTEEIERQCILRVANEVQKEVLETRNRKLRNEVESAAMNIIIFFEQKKKKWNNFLRNEQQFFEDEDAEEDENNKGEISNDSENEAENIGDFQHHDEQQQKGTRRTEANTKPNANDDKYKNYQYRLKMILKENLACFMTCMKI